MSKTSTFKPAWWLKNRHLQTMAAKLLRRKETIEVIKETIELSDGDFLDLVWTEDPLQSLEKPIVVVLHGLEGSIDSHYAKGMMNAISARGWVGLLMHFRGCSGRPNRHAQSYHSGATDDVHFLTGLLRERYPERQFGILGFSLGGNVLAKYLAEDNDPLYQSGVIICAPLHLASCAQQINVGFSKIYQKYLVDMLKDSTSQKVSMQLINHIDHNELKAIRSLYDFDQKVTAPLNGFKDANDYYEKASGIYVLGQVNRPTLILHAQDDPFLSNEHIMALDMSNPSITFEVSEYGGHVGFIAGTNPFKPMYWLEDRVLDHIAQHFKSETGREEIPR
ncbi:hydrolase [Thalassotalea mangrovi]|uniref:Hydrolase n=1 Tax=Thalassotalea mangrovi TaxID=2572245 RepID=A0A4U1B4Z4_9GAMM|nr:hydrolase [Thalassotalea mangrovi]TKB45480.1 hydrolase [Thalassotalea mangrovi]